jgi:hypothetical protein
MKLNYVAEGSLVSSELIDGLITKLIELNNIALAIQMIVGLNFGNSMRSKKVNEAIDFLKSRGVVEI